MLVCNPYEIVIHGTTSKGKTSTLLDPAASVWGSPDRFAKKWRTTQNGLEALCLGRNDNLLILDELAQIAAADAGGAAYLIANGQAKARMTKEGGNRPAQTWRVMLLSAGEIDLAQHMAEAGKTARGGQMARLPAIPADAGAGMGTLEALHHHTSGQAFADAMKGSARRYYGTAGQAFLEKLASPEEQQTIRAEVRAQVAKALGHMGIPDGAAEEVGRVAARFALVAFAGELATRYGVTGWQPREAFCAARRCFREWLAENNTGQAADDRALFARLIQPARRRAHRFSVLLPRQECDPALNDKVRQVLAREAPAHTVYEIAEYELALRVGSARLGVDSVLGARAGWTPLIIDQSHLGLSWLAPPPAEAGRWPADRYPITS